MLEVEIAGRDALEADDAARVVMGPARGSAALLVRPEGGADPFVRRAVDVSTRGNFAEMSEEEWEGGAGAAGGWAYVVFDGVAAEREPRAPSIHLGAGAPFAGVRLARYEGEGGGAGGGVGAPSPGAAVRGARRGAAGGADRAGNDRG